jgi:hypothetical protein
MRRKGKRYKDQKRKQKREWEQRGKGLWFMVPTLTR